MFGPSIYDISGGLTFRTGTQGKHGRDAWGVDGWRGPFLDMECNRRCRQAVRRLRGRGGSLQNGGHLDQSKAKGDLCKRTGDERNRTAVEGGGAKRQNRALTSARSDFQVKFDSGEAGLR